MKTSDLKYLFALVLPTFGLLCTLDPSRFYWPVVFFTFIGVPALDYLFPPDRTNHEPEEETSRSVHLFFDILAYLNFPLIWLIVIVGLNNLSSANLDSVQFAMSVLSIGITLSICGNVVAHELGHRSDAISKWIGLLMLLPSFYMHFQIEHNYGHHKNAATPLDPGTAAKGESIYRYWIKSPVCGYFKAWAIENRRMRSKYGRVFHPRNRMLIFHSFEAIYASAVVALFGLKGILIAFAIAVTALLLFEIGSYIEHYGLLRKTLKNGGYERLKPKHSWNCNRSFGRIVLFDFTRHSDHHQSPRRKYQMLRNVDDGLHLPVSFSTAVLLVLIPPLWFKLVDPVIDVANEYNCSITPGGDLKEEVGEDALEVCQI